jgi:hypothetical protein
MTCLARVVCLPQLLNQRNKDRNKFHYLREPVPNCRGRYADAFRDRLFLNGEHDQVSIFKLFRTIWVLILLFLSGCGPSAIGETPVLSPSPKIDETPTPALSFEDQKIWDLWQRSMHGRKKSNVPCDTCHLVEIVGQSYKVGTASKDLCIQCHSEVIEMKEQATDVHSQLDCIFCHDPHALTGSCSNSVCHPDVASDLDILAGIAVPPGHESTGTQSCAGGSCHIVATQVAFDGRITHISPQHSFLSCAACHDALNLDVGPLENNIHWDTWLPAAHGEEAKPFASHVFQREVQCARCHFKDNPWKLRFPVGN